MPSICGVYNYNKELPVAKQELECMLETMRHRGGSKQEIFIKENVGIAYTHYDSEHTHDAELSTQVFCALNGSIANLKSLAHELETDDPRFQGYCPSELVAALYQKEGISFLTQLDGGFCLAIWDEREKRLILARDRFGIKPVYYFEDKKGVIFATEIKGILEVLNENPTVNFGAMQEYLTFRYVAGTSTMFQGVKELEPRCYILWSGHNKAKRKYWSLEDAYSEARPDKIDYYLDCLQGLFKDAIKKRIQFSDRLGANCSGGIDSGLVTAFLSSLLRKPFHTFTIGFNEEGWDERYYAALTAKKYNSIHHEIVVNSGQFFHQLAKLNWHNDEPLSDPNSVLVYLLAEYSKDRIDLLLTGEGADEVFLGYPRYNLINLYLLGLLIPIRARFALANLMSLSSNRRIRKLTEIMKQNESQAIIFNSAFVPSETLQGILSPDLITRTFSSRRRILEESGDKDLLSQTMLFEIKTYLVSSLNRLEKMNMAQGMETATPFLDNDLFEFTLRIPKDHKIKILSNKHILRKLALKYLSLENLKMPKSGFGVPICRWFRTDEYSRMILRELQRDGFIGQVFNKKMLNQLISQHMVDENYDHSEILWLIANLFVWHQRFFRN